MDFEKLIEARRSVRGYAEGIDRAELEAILKRAQMAPSWKNSQTARCYAVTSPELLEKVRAQALPSFNQNSSAHAALVVTTFVKDTAGFTGGVPDNEAGNCWGAYDLGLHDAYLVLAASDAGYDTLIMGIRDEAALRELLGIPEAEAVMSVIAVGKRAKEPALRPRKPLEEVAKFF